MSEPSMVLLAVVVGFVLGYVILLAVDMYARRSFQRKMDRVIDHADRMPGPDTYWAAYAEGDEEALEAVEEWEWNQP